MDGPRDRTEEFERHFQHALGRLRRRAAARAAATLLPWLQIAWLIVWVAARRGVLTPPLPEILAGLAAVLAAGVLWSAWRSPTGRDAALVLDCRLGTRELVTAAHEAPAEAAHPFARMARRRAGAALADAAVAAALPFTSWRRWRPALLGLATVLLAALLPPPQEKAVAAAAEVDPVVEATAASLAEELAPLAEELGDLDRPEAQDALARLQEMVDEMRRGDLPTVEDALVALSQAEETVDALRETAPGGFDALVEDLAGEPFSAELARAMTEDDREALRQTLERMADAMTGAEAESAAMKRQLERFAERLAELADLLAASGEQELAAELRELVDALRSGDLERAREMLESEGVAKACRAGGEHAEGEGMAGELAELLQLGRFLLGQSKPQSLAEEGRTPQQAGASQKRDGAGPHPGDESTHSEGESYATGDPILRDRESNRWTEQAGDFEALYDSRLERGEGFEDFQALGQVGESGEMLSETGRGLGVDDGASLPLRPFGAAASGAPERAMDLEDVPLGYRDLVRGYFERDAPAAPAAAAPTPTNAGEKGDGHE